jgi:REP element-mobilizing transposase RayT
MFLFVGAEIIEQRSERPRKQSDERQALGRARRSCSSLSRLPRGMRSIAVDPHVGLCFRAATIRDSTSSLTFVGKRCGRFERSSNASRLPVSRYCPYAAETAGAPHKKRPTLKRWQPVHVVLRVVEDVGSLRKRHMYKALREATISVARRELNDLRDGAFRIVHLSIQRHHVHLLVEADHKLALSRGMQAFQISAAKHLNRAVSIVRIRRASPDALRAAGASGAANGLRAYSVTGAKRLLREQRELRRRGTVFPDRFHQEIISTPKQARHALAYVLNNWRKHREDRWDFAAQWSVARTRRARTSTAGRSARTLSSCGGCARRISRWSCTSREHGSYARAGASTASSASTRCRARGRWSACGAQQCDASARYSCAVSWISRPCRPSASTLRPWRVRSRGYGPT